MMNENLNGWFVNSPPLFQVSPSPSLGLSRFSPLISSLLQLNFFNFAIIAILVSLASVSQQIEHGM
jgi:hypothetical protein